MTIWRNRIACWITNATSTHSEYVILNAFPLQQWFTKVNHCCSKVTDKLKLKINVTPNLTMMVTGHGNIKSYLYKYKIIDSLMCPCKIGEQTTDHI